MMNFTKMLKAGDITSNDAIFFEDMFQPGMESLPYILQQTLKSTDPIYLYEWGKHRPIDDDFVHVWGMSKWMSYMNRCAMRFQCCYITSNEEMVAHMRIANWKVSIQHNGLSFGKEEVPKS